ncbi:hypothetical protein ILUMI_06598 [Ignelater luminosus]|uniref:Uncharacterized protein n=1 Tax=Ignelater luminosus TaxID=2038154 RepID=A0A8K0GIW6_IGNLU|nr:hypothetical protein ILUMI_06598 [Ignelater luminosus]
MALISMEKQNSSAKRRLFSKQNTEPLKKKSKGEHLSRNTDYGIYANQPEEEYNKEFILMESRLEMQKLQIQGPLNITKREKCYLMVYVNDNIPIFVEEIRKDVLFSQHKMLPTLTNFYEQCIAPELVRGNLKYNKRCIDPPYRNKNKIPNKPQI